MEAFDSDAGVREGYDRVRRRGYRAHKARMRFRFLRGEYAESGNGTSNSENHNKNDAGSDRTDDEDEETAGDDGSGTEEKEGEVEDIDESGSEISEDSDETGDDSDETWAGGDDAGETDDEPVECTGVSLESEGKLSGSVPSTTYSVKIAGNILGDPAVEDWFELRLDHHRFGNDPYVATGSYDLAEGVNMHNASFWRCWECVSARQDRGSEGEKFFFQKKGTLVIDSVDEKCSFKATLSAVLIESVIENYTNIPVKNGECLEIETAIDATTYCSRDCEDKEVGANDGCCSTCEE